MNPPSEEEGVFTAGANRDHQDLPRSPFVRAAQVADLSLGKSHKGTLKKGHHGSYTITVTNKGRSDPAVEMETTDGRKGEDVTGGG